MSTVSLFFLLFTLFSSYYCNTTCNNYTYEWYPCFHFGPRISYLTKVGWMNDPNGFVLFKKLYHLFYQYNPYSSIDPGIAHWGHAQSSDLVYWEHLPIALYPDKPYDRDGVFSGSAIVENNTMYLYYTGNVNHKGQNPDHEQHQILATSTDGLTFKKDGKNPIIDGDDRQPNFRDPFVWKTDDAYYMVLGNSYNNDTRGRVLLYNSTDKKNWNEVSVVDQSEGKLGYMWECPALFKLGKHYVLTFSPQGVKAEGDMYKNLYLTGYIVGDFDLDTKVFTPLYPFRELDRGHDFYATQTMITKEGDRVIVAWMDMWKQNYPEGPDGFTGMLTLPRVLKLTSDGRLLQKPLKSIAKAFGNKLYAGEAYAGQKVKLEYNAARIKVQASKVNNFTLLIESDCANDTVTITYDAEGGRVILDRGGEDGVRRAEFSPKSIFIMTVYMDKSSIEVIYGCGELTMSSRFFPKGTVTILVGTDSHADMLKVNTMKCTIAAPNTYV